MATNKKLTFGLSALVALTGLVAGCSDDEKPSTSSSSGGAGDAATSGDSSAAKKNGEVGCTADTECESNVCFQGGQQSFCSLKCTADTAATICVAPFTGGCNNKGYCKRD